MRSSEHEDLRALRAALLESAKSDTPSPRVVARTMAAVSLAATAGAGSAGAAASGAATVARGMIWKWFLVGSIGGAAAIGLHQVAFDVTPGPIGAGSSSVHKPVSRPGSSLAKRGLPESPEPATSSAPSVAASTQPADTPSRAPVGVAAPKPPTSNGVAEAPALLAKEIAILDQARRALASGEPGVSIDALRRFDKECPNAQLANEATALRIEALVLEGNCTRADALGRSLLAAQPHTPVAQRVKALLRRCVPTKTTD